MSISKVQKPFLKDVLFAFFRQFLPQKKKYAGVSQMSKFRNVFINDSFYNTAEFLEVR